MAANFQFNSCVISEFSAPPLTIWSLTTHIGHFGRQPMRTMSSGYQKIEARTFRAEFCARNFWVGLGRFPAIPLCAALCYNRVSCMINNRDRKLFRSLRKNSKFWSDDWQRRSFWSAFRHIGAHFAESSRIFKPSWMIEPNRSHEKLSYPAIAWAQIRRSSKIRWGIW